MSQPDTRPAWMLRKHARISQRRLERFAKRPELLTLEAWWQQIVEAAADLALEAGAQGDWQAWPSWEHAEEL